MLCPCFYFEFPQIGRRNCFGFGSTTLKRKMLDVFSSLITYKLFTSCLRTRAYPKNFHGINLFRCSICPSFLRYEDESTETKEDQRYKLLKVRRAETHNLPPPSPPLPRHLLLENLATFLNVLWCKFCYGEFTRSAEARLRSENYYNVLSKYIVRYQWGYLTFSRLCLNNILFLLLRFLAQYFEGVFPRDNPRNTRFSINFFTSIGLGGITYVPFYIYKYRNFSIVTERLVNTMNLGKFVQSRGEG